MIEELFSLKAIFKRYPFRITLTLLLVVSESLLDLLFPLVIGWAVNDLVNSEFKGLVMLGVLGITSLFIGSARRFYDTRLYSGIYSETASRVVSSGRKQGLSVSKISARSSLLTELVEFFEHSISGIFLSLIGVVGALAVIATLNFEIFFACLGLLLLMTTMYFLTGGKQYQYHSHYNQILEQRVDFLSGRTNAAVRSHFLNLMRWNVKLSDIETLNFGIIWLGTIALLIATPLLAIDGAKSVPKVGTILALFIYVLDYSEKVVTLPFFIQQLIRLKEISNRMN
ncbi:ABC transporter six-transmembrane domain-containing protein [Alteromonas naphthalenivorans]|uniref:ABC transmembrane type-1 domain-containing protein n=1 Tax=Alteromonas naphthalenivorans TaxID=715451 RepID=F5ZFX1_ALTNA|nr:ABC transporter six-transmembrane domain-containing protein [Alteromonas naphthalenivorans]AEF05739.1 hypothetical protein ambt_21240 [Alteromonas naphthalenivorans]